MGLELERRFAMSVEQSLGKSSISCWIRHRLETMETLVNTLVTMQSSLAHTRTVIVFDYCYVRIWSLLQ